MNLPSRSREERFRFPSSLRKGLGEGLSGPCNSPSPNPSREREGNA